MTFNADEVAEREDFSPVPPGIYTGMITNSELKETNSKTGQYILLEIDIQGGEYEGRKLFERLNIKNDNQKAVDIAFRTLGEIVKAVGKTTIKDTEELHNKKFTMEVRVEPAKPYVKDGVEQPGSPQNSIKKFLPVSGAVSTPKAGSSTATSATAESKASDESVPPWKRKKG